MSKSAFNAMLKTLEEPPDAVKFIFATTEIRKVPVTILSRCQRYDLRRVPAALLTKHLCMICEREVIAADRDALAAIARAAEGSVRDALSLLDQASAMAAEKLTNSLVADMLGRPGRSDSYTILSAAFSGDCGTALATFETAYSRGSEPEVLITDLLDLIHLASMQAAGGNDEALMESERKIVASLAAEGIARLGRAWQLLLKGHAELGQAPNPAAACEMLIIRLAHAAQMPTPAELMQKIAQKPNASPSKSPAPSATDSNIPASSTRGAQKQPNLDQTNQALTQLTSLTSIVDLAENNGEMLLAARIRNHVRLVSLKPGNLQITLAGAAPDQLAEEIARSLSKWTGQHWLVHYPNLVARNTCRTSA